VRLHRPRDLKAKETVGFAIASRAEGIFRRVGAAVKHRRVQALPSMPRTGHALSP
jgi:hypothetical protein